MLYSSQKSNSNRRKYDLPNYTKEEFKEWLLKQGIKDLYNNWVNSNYNKTLKPSVDRLNDYLPYTFSNIQLITWGKNFKKGNDDRFNGINNKQSYSILCYNLKGVFIKEYNSLSIAARDLNILQSHISRCIQDDNTNGKLHSVKNYTFRRKLNMTIPLQIKVVLKSKNVYQYSFNGILIETYSSVTNAAAKVGVTKTAISNALTGKTNSSAGYIWKFNK